MEDLGWAGAEQRAMCTCSSFPHQYTSGECGVNKTQKQVHAAPLAEAQVYRAGPQKQGGDSVTRVLDCTNDEQRCVWLGGAVWDPCGRMLEDDGKQLQSHWGLLGRVF